MDKFKKFIEQHKEKIYRIGRKNLAEEIQMIKTHKENIKKEQEVIDSIACNKCGKEFLQGDTCVEYENNMEFHHYQETGGYFSKIGDYIEFKFDLCDDCLIELMTTFKIPPQFEDTNYKDEDTQTDYEKWLLEEKIKGENKNE
jgi:hypothetical protein